MRRAARLNAACECDCNGKEGSEGKPTTGERALRARKAGGVFTRRKSVSTAGARRIEAFGEGGPGSVGWRGGLAFAAPPFAKEFPPPPNLLTSPFNTYVHSRLYRDGGKKSQSHSRRPSRRLRPRLRCKMGCTWGIGKGRVYQENLAYTLWERPLFRGKNRELFCSLYWSLLGS